MSGSISEIIGDILSGSDKQGELSEIVKKLSSENHVNTAVKQSEKQLELQKKIEIIQALKPLFGDDFSKKANLIINALTAAKIIIGLKNDFSE